MIQKTEISFIPHKVRYLVLEAEQEDIKDLYETRDELVLFLNRQYHASIEFTNWDEYVCKNSSVEAFSKSENVTKAFDIFVKFMTNSPSIQLIKVAYEDLQVQVLWNVLVGMTFSNSCVIMIIFLMKV